MSKIEIEDLDKKQDGLPSTMRLELTSIEREYNKVRHTLYTETQTYYRQSIGSNYIKEDGLLDLISKCKRLKFEYHKVQMSLMEQNRKG